jgi:hypothetical protein
MKNAPIKELLLAGFIFTTLLINKNHEKNQQYLWKQKHQIQLGK